MELADLVVINKADIDADAATRAQAQITSALRLFGSHGHHQHQAQNDTAYWHAQVLQLSALLGQGVTAFWAAVEEFQRLQSANGLHGAKRQRQSQTWMWERIEAGLKQAFRAHPGVRTQLPLLQQQVLDGSLPASTAARRLLALAATSQAEAGHPVNAGGTEGAA